MYRFAIFLALSTSKPQSPDTENTFFFQNSLYLDSVSAILCDSPGSVIHGKYSPALTHYSIGENVIYRCKRGYRRIGDQLATCVLDEEGLTASFTPAPVCESENLDTDRNFMTVFELGEVYQIHSNCLCRNNL